MTLTSCLKTICGILIIVPFAFCAGYLMLNFFLNIVYNIIDKPKFFSLCCFFYFRIPYCWILSVSFYFPVLLFPCFYYTIFFAFQVHKISVSLVYYFECDPSSFIIQLQCGVAIKSARNRQISVSSALFSVRILPQITFFWTSRKIRLYVSASHFVRNRHQPCIHSARQAAEWAGEYRRFC